MVAATGARPRQGMGGKMAGGNPDPSRGRDPDEFYPTPPDVTRALYLQYAHMLKGVTVFEPCAGDGAMAETLLECGVGRTLCMDIKPRKRAGIPTAVNEYPITTGDVMKLTRLPAVDAIITNPPFDIAADIINHILCLPGGPPQFLGLVLKSTFWHAMRRAEMFDKFRPTAVHPLRWRPDFKNLGAPTMEIMWCVWIARSHSLHPTLYVPLNRPKAT